MSTASRLLEPELNSFQQYLEARRNELDLEWKELAAATNIPYSSLRRIFLDPVLPPNKERLQRICRALKLPYKLVEARALAAIAEHFGYTVHLREERSADLELLIASAEELTAEEVRSVQQMIETLRRTIG